MKKILPWIFLSIFLNFTPLFSFFSHAQTISLPSSSILILVDEATYSHISSEIERYRTDIIRDLGKSVSVVKKNWQNGLQLRIALKEVYGRSTPPLEGVVFVGDIPTIETEFMTRNQELNRERSYFDYFYADMSEGVQDRNGNGKIEVDDYDMSENWLPDIWVGRLKPPAQGMQGIEMLKKYFERNHRYRTGALSYNKKALFWDNMIINYRDEVRGVNLPTIETSLANYKSKVQKFVARSRRYQSQEVDFIYDENLETQKQLFLEKQSSERGELAYLNFHGTPTTQWLGQNTQLQGSDYMLKKPSYLFYRIVSCSNGAFLEDSYLAGQILFGGEALVVEAFSIVTLFSEDTNLYNDFALLSGSAIFGEYFKHRVAGYPPHLFGDPTLKMPQIFPSEPLKLQNPIAAVNFGNVDINAATLTQTFPIANRGLTELKLYPITSSFIDSLNGENIFKYTGLTGSGLIFRSENLHQPIIIPAGSSVNIPIEFNPAALQRYRGTYRGVFYFATNDTKTPLFTIRTEATLMDAQNPNENIRISNPLGNQPEIAWTTAMLFSSAVYFGTDRNNLNQVVSSPQLVSEHRLSLPSLERNRKYYFRVSSADSQGRTIQGEILNFLTFERSVPPLLPPPPPPPAPQPPPPPSLDSSPTQPPPPPQFQPEQAVKIIQLKLNRRGRFEPSQLNVKLKKVLEDSRCPQDVVCVDGGRVTVSLVVWKDDRRERIKLTFDPVYPDLATQKIFGALISLKRVEPQPIEKKRILKSQYRFTLAVF